MSIRRAPFHPGNLLHPIVEVPAWRTLAGYPGSTGSNDGPGVQARFSNPSGIVVDSAGVIYVANSGNHVIRTISPAGMVSTLAGHAGIAGWRDGAATNTLFNNPIGLALAPDGTLYVADLYNHVVRQISPTGVVRTIAGRHEVSGYQDGLGTNAMFSYPKGLALDTNGNLYVADSGTVIRKINPLGMVSTFAGRANVSGYQDGQGTNAQFSGVSGLALDSKGNLYAADQWNNVIRRISPEGSVTTWVGRQDRPVYRDGQGTNAWLAGPVDLCMDGQGTLYVTESENHCVRKISPDGEVRTLGGGVYNRGMYGLGNEPHDFVDGPAPFMRFGTPSGIAVDASGHWLATDSVNHTIRYGGSGSEASARLLRQPVSQVGQVGATATFRIAAQETVPHTCQWLVDGQIIPGATNDVLVLESLKASDAGEYRAAILNGLGYFLSFPASLQVLPAKTAGTAPLDNWQLLATPALQRVRGLAYGNGRYVAVGSGEEWDLSTQGLMATSMDGEHWMTQPRASSEALYSIAFGNGQFVAVGNNATLLTSADGLAWTPQVLTTEGRPNLNGITFAKGMFVAVSGDTHGSIWTSTDGLQWTNRGVDIGLSLMAVKAAGDKFIAVGNTILVSTNGLDWAPANVPTNFVGEEVLLQHLAYGQGTFLSSEGRGGGHLTSSPNGLDWADAAGTNGLNFSAVAFANGKFVAVDMNAVGITSSPDGQTWTTPTLLTNVDHSVGQLDLCFEQGLFLATGDAGALFTSTDGVSWTFRQQQHGLLFTPDMIIQALDRYFGVGWPGIQTSTNGSDWSLLVGNQGFSCLAYGAGTLVAGGNGETILTSNDGGATWTDRSPHLDWGDLSYWSVPGLSRMAYGTGTFAAVGMQSHYGETPQSKGRILVSSDAGVTWTASSPALPVSDIAFGGGRFVALKFTSRDYPAREIIVSTNGLDWNSARTFPTNGLNTIAHGNGRFVIGSGPAMVITSIDGAKWDIQDVPGVEYFNRVVFGNGLFLATTSIGLCSSVDGLAWTRVAGPRQDLNYNNVFAVAGRFLAIDSDNNLYESGPFERLETPPGLSGPDLQWTLIGASQLNGRVEFSEDLLNWQTLTRFSNAPPRYSFTDPGAANRPRRFYRVAIE